MVFQPRSENERNAALVLDNLLERGVEAFIISPGYRNAPIISLLVKADVHCLSVFDERSAAALALGIGRATGRPAVLVCTSGTAPAHYFPAVMEAKMAKIPLIVWSADRPEDLVFAGANQAVVQRGLFGDYGVSELMIPHRIENPLEYDWRLKEVLWGEDKGAIHLNQAFKAPLEPGPEILPYQKPPRKFMLEPKPSALRQEEVNLFLEPMKKAERGFLVLGPGVDGQRAKALVEDLKWPVWADVEVSLQSPLCVKGTYEEFFEFLLSYRPTVLCHFGGRIVSMEVERYLKSTDVLPEFYGICSLSKRLQTECFSVNARLHACPKQLIDALLAARPFGPRPDFLLPKKRVQADEQSSFTLECWAKKLLSNLDGRPLFLGNSLTIRQFDQLPSYQGRVFTHRGVSGIEGFISQAIGLALGSKQPILLVVGDVASLHDLQGFLLLGQTKANVGVLIVNNGGGRIFHRLPVKHHKSILQPFLDTPHSYRFEPIAKMAGLPYFLADSFLTWEHVFFEFLKADGPFVGECVMADGDVSSLPESHSRQ